MKAKLKIRKLFLFTLVLSICCSVYLYTYYGLHIAPELDVYSAEYSSGSYSSVGKFLPEIEVVKIIVEKIIDIVTVSKI